MTLKEFDLIGLELNELQMHMLTWIQLVVSKEIRDREEKVKEAGKKKVKSVEEELQHPKMDKEAIV